MMDERFEDVVLDRAIDEVARELTSGAPRAGFDARVRARIAETPAPFRWTWPLAAVTALALATVVYLWQPAKPTPDGSRVVRVTPSSEGGASPSGPRARTEQNERGRITPARRTTPHRRAVPDRPTIRIPIEEDAPQIAALAQMPDLTLEPIELTEITIPPLEPEKEPR